MAQDNLKKNVISPEEVSEWFDSLENVKKRLGPDAVKELIARLQVHALQSGVSLPFSANTPYINTIHYRKQPSFPGNLEIEWRIRSLLRWNAMAMVVRANRNSEGIGGHISTYASGAMLLEIGFNHFFRGKDHACGGDIIYFQGHSTPGIYARAFLEGRLTQDQLENFRHELADNGGLSSYPHPWLMPDFWEYPTVSMGLGPITAIYHARFCKYLKDRGLTKENEKKIWAFLGDGETDEPETLGALTLASREKLDNLIFVINCNLQRLDGPVRGNGKIIQELEAVFRGAGWNVIKVVWGREWDELLDNDSQGQLVERMGQALDGDYQKYSVSDGSYIREHFFGTKPELKQMVEHLSDDKLKKLRRGGHDAEKVYSAYKQATEHKGQPTVILAKTVKGYGLGEAGEGKNVTHQQKKMNEDELRDFRTRFGIPISDEDVATAPFYKPSENSPEMQYIRQRRQALGGSVPERRVHFNPIAKPEAKCFEEFNAGSQGREVSTTMAFVRILGKLLQDKNIGKLIVPIVPDEARTFGMEALFRQIGIYSHVGQLYQPVDSESLMYYKESTDGQLLEEGITEAGSISSFIAAGTAYANHGVNTIPFFIYYSMFGFQRIGDFVWAAGDMRCKGFLIGATAGRTTLAGEGLQHQDGHSHLLSLPIPNLKCYDPAFAYEIATLIEDGIERMYVNNENIFYYITVGNENYEQPKMPEGSVKNLKEGIIKGLYLFAKSPLKKAKLKAQLFGSGAILNEVIKAQQVLADEYGVMADVWSVTSYKELRQNAMDTERYNLLHPEKKPQISYLEECLGKTEGVLVAASDYVKILPDMISKWMPRRLYTLGTDGYGRSESRQALRDFFEVDYRYIVVATLKALCDEGQINAKDVAKAIKDFKINPDKKNPTIS